MIARSSCPALRARRVRKIPRFRFGALAQAALAFAALPALAEDWPRFRGSMRDGAWRETGLLKTFPAEGLKVRWRAPASGGWSSPVIAQGREFLADSELATPAARERVRCFDEATGVLRWTFTYDVTYPEWAFVPGQGGGPTATPVVEAGRVFAVGINGHVHCLDARTGAVLWERDLQMDYEVREHICRPSPLIVLLFTDQGELIRAQLTPQGYREESRARLIEPTTPYGGRNCAWAPPAFANLHVFARNEKELVCASLAEHQSHEK